MIQTRSRHLVVLHFTLALGLARAGSDPAPGLAGAAKALARIQTAVHASSEPDAGPPKGTGPTFLADLEAFAARAESLAPDAAAAGWLALHDRFMKLPPGVGLSDAGMGLDYPKVLAALPPPAAWPALEAAIAARPEPDDRPRFEKLALGTLVAVLRGDKAGLEARRAQLAARRDRGGTTGFTRDDFTTKSLLEAIETTLTGRSGRVLEEFRRELAQHESKPTEGPAASLAVPDLAASLGEAEGKALLGRALATGAPLYFAQVSPATYAWARAVALAQVASLKRPPWSLAAHREGAPLFAALAARFPQAPRPAPEAGERARSEWQGERAARDGAARHAFLAALAAGDEPGATRLAAELAAFVSELGGGDGSGYRPAEGQLPEDGRDAVLRAGRAEQLLAHLERMVTATPENPYWDDYAELGASLGQDRRVLATLAKAREGVGPTGPVARRLRGLTVKLLLAAGRLDEARPLVVPDLAEAPGRYLSGRVDGMTWMAIGRLSARPEIEAEGREAALAAFDRALVDQPDGVEYSAQALALALEEAGRPGQAEDVLVRAIVASLGRANGGGFDGSGGGARNGLAALAGLYHRQGRHADVVALLEGSPDWGAADLAEVLATPAGARRSLGAIAGVALAAVGRRDPARKVLEAALVADPSCDPAYQAYLEVAGPEAPAFLDFLARRNRFEERPLLWRARHELSAGRAGEAEALVRRAIEIDPSDGDSGPGDRMRAYAILADCLEARGDGPGVAFFRKVVESIRRAEKADAFHAAGLTAESLRRYEDALELFGDAYCIRSRLAMRYAETGNLAKARENYRKAFALMPASFGFMESHCFGCEGIFRGPLAQSIADEVLAETGSADERPQVPYLVGFLREAEGRTDEARDAYLRATRKARDYLNAWTKLTEIQQRTPVPAADLGAAAVELLRLDPLGLKGRHQFPAGLGLEAAWKAAAEARALSYPKPAALLPLVASRERKRLLASIQGTRREAGRDWMAEQNERAFEVQAPGARLATHPLIQAVSNALSQQRMMGEGF